MFRIVLHPFGLTSVDCSRECHDYPPDVYTGGVEAMFDMPANLTKYPRVTAVSDDPNKRIIMRAIADDVTYLEVTHPTTPLPRSMPRT